MPQIKCIDNKGAEGSLTPGKDYELVEIYTYQTGIQEEHETFFVVIDDDGREAPCYQWRFQMQIKFNKES